MSLMHHFIHAKIMFGCGMIIAYAYKCE